MRSERDALSQVRDIALFICLILVVLNLVTTLRVISLTNDLNDAATRGQAHAVKDCETLRAVTQSLIDLNSNLIRIDLQHGDPTDKALAAERAKAVEDLKKIRPSSCAE